MLDGDSIKDTIARGASSGIIAYVGKGGDGYKPFIFESGLSANEVEVSEDMFIITAEEAKKHVEPPRLTTLAVLPERPHIKPGTHQQFQAKGYDQHGRPFAVSDIKWNSQGGEIDAKGGFAAGNDEGEFLIEAAAGDSRVQTTIVVAKADATPPPPKPTPDKPTEISGLRWSGDVPPQKWMNFYTKVLAKYATTGGLKLRVSFEVSPEGGLLPQRLEETKAVLRELGLVDDVDATG